MKKVKFLYCMLGIAIFLSILGIMSSYLKQYTINDIVLFLQVMLMTVLFIKETMENHKLYKENERLKSALRIKEFENELLHKNRVKN